jgi:nucleoside-diphosphate-sugar epimerase
MSLALVTGGTGFIGLHLVEGLLRRGYRVRCLVRSTSNVEALRPLAVELVHGGLDDGASLRLAARGADVVFHSAGIIRAFRSQDFYQVNHLGTLLVAEACAAQAKPPRLVFVSSIAAAGPSSRGQIRIEADVPSPVSHYGRSKLAAENSAIEFADLVPVTIVRPGIVFGPRDTGFIQVLRSIRHFRCHLSPGFFPPALSYIHVEDLVELLCLAAERGTRAPARANSRPARGTYFAVAQEHPTYAELGRLLRPMLGRNHAPIIAVPPALAYCLGGLNEFVGRMRGRAEELCVDKIRDALVPSWACSGESAHRELGFLPAKPLAERLRETVDWYMANNSL